MARRPIGGFASSVFFIAELFNLTVAWSSHRMEANHPGGESVRSLAKPRGFNRIVQVLNRFFVSLGLRLMPADVKLIEECRILCEHHPIDQMRIEDHPA